MLKQALGTAVAAVFATAIAGAQVPAQDQPDQREGQAAQQMVTVEGCLQEDRVASAQVADAARDDDKTFLLVNAEVQPGPGAMADARPDEPTARPEVGTAGQPGTQPETPVGTSGAAMSATTFKVVGLDDERLAQYAGQRVRIEGHIERSEDRGITGADTDADRPDTERVTPDPAAPGTAGTTGTPESPTTGAAAAGEVKKLKAVSIQPVAGSCPESPAG